MKIISPHRKVMSILNVTPDSFFVDSRAEQQGAIRSRVEQMMREGADIIDIGGYSTRPGAQDVSPEEECQRVLLGASEVRSVAPDVTISIDTFRSEVAEAVLRRYERVIINDVSGGERDRRMAEVVAHYAAPMVVMHSRGTPQTMQSLTAYGDVVEEVRDHLARRADILTAQGVGEIILDPGIGFAKTQEQNFALIASLERITSLGYPVLAGISRKSFMCRALDISPDEALEATTALHWACLERGASILRVHDTLAAKQTISLYEKIYRL
jgi:dihydropteroate synthase